MKVKVIRKKKDEPENLKKQDLEENEAPDQSADENVIVEEVQQGEEDFTDLEKAEKEWLQEKENLLDQVKRKQADIDNLRRISRQEQETAREYALQDFLSRLLPVIDNLERGIESARCDDNIPLSYIEGLEMIRKQMMQIFEQEGVTKIEAEGCKFDPNCHHAVLQEESEESEPGTVLAELQKGYRHKKRVLRPAMVKVCRE